MSRHFLKNMTFILFAVSITFTLSACGNKEQPSETVQSTNSKTTESNQSNSVPDDTETGAVNAAVDDIVDLTVLSGTIVYAEVNRMMVEPENYMGRTVTMEGQFNVTEGEGRNYYSCIIADAAACCAQGIEFELEGDYNYPEDYPEVGSTITVTGIFDTYTEGKWTYCRLTDATLT